MLGICTALVLTQAGAGQAAPGIARQAIPRAIPAAVTQGLATPTGAYPADTTMQVNVGMAVRNPAQLDDLIAAASTPGSPSYGRYLTQAEYLADFAPTDASVGAARAWLASNGLTVTNVSPDNLIIGVEGSVSKVEGAFGVSIESFRDGNRSFYANTANPTVPSNLSISWVGGLNDAAVIEAAHSSVHPASGYSPNDLRKAYNVSGAGTGQSIGFTLWGAEIPQSDFNGYASGTGTTAIKVGQSGADGLDWVQVDGASSHHEHRRGDRPRHRDRPWSRAGKPSHLLARTRQHQHEHRGRRQCSSELERLDRLEQLGLRQRLLRPDPGERASARRGDRQDVLLLDR